MAGYLTKESSIVHFCCFLKQLHRPDSPNPQLLAIILIFKKVANTFPFAEQKNSTKAVNDEKRQIC